MRVATLLVLLAALTTGCAGYNGSSGESATAQPQTETETETEPVEGDDGEEQIVFATLRDRPGD